ncbi:MAG: FHIPEP family type III secretion protein, partial [Deltaproteobacteria bacterium]|nr:FHIPEP family type III secretion protein [Deltaproteobacteria bacterium]
QQTVVKEEKKVEEQRQASAAPSSSPEQVEALLPLDVLELEVGYGLIPLVDEEQNGELLDRIRSIRRQFALDMGFIVPPMHVRDNLQLKPGEYAVLLKGIELARSELMVGYYLAMDPGDAKPMIDGIETREPAFNLPALWILEKKKEEAQRAGWTVVDPATVISTHLTEIIRKCADELLTRQDVQKLIENANKTNAKVIEELIPNLMNVGQIQKVLQALLRERVSIRDLQTILETLADRAMLTKDPELLTEFVRQRLARSIIRQYETREGELPILTLGPDIEDLMTKSISETDRGSYISMDPELGQRIIHAINQAYEKFTQLSYQPVLLCSPLVRRYVRKLTERFIPNLAVLSHNELTATVQLKVLGEAGFMNAN